MRAAARGWAGFGWSLAAVGVMILVGSTPVVGGLLWLLAFFIGLGAVAVEARRALAQG